MSGRNFSSQELFCFPKSSLGLVGNGISVIAQPGFLLSLLGLSTQILPWHLQKGNPGLRRFSRAWKTNLGSVGKAVIPCFPMSCRDDPTLDQQSSGVVLAHTETLDFNDLCRKSESFIHSTCLFIGI